MYTAAQKHKTQTEKRKYLSLQQFLFTHLAQHTTTQHNQESRNLIKKKKGF